jgi:ABC-type spermidine/putrescine transport system permease subunit I
MAILVAVGITVLTAVLAYKFCLFVEKYGDRISAWMRSKRKAA